MDNAHKIDYKLLAEAFSYYESKGYTYIEVPWIVSTGIQMITCPSEDMIYKTHGGGLVGSAEQSFIDLELQDKLNPCSKYFTITPCFRLGDSKTSPLHQEYFMKLELYSNDWCDPFGYWGVLDDAMRFFQMHTTHETLVNHNKHHSSDIEINGIEVGSYGERFIPNREHPIFYGTGLALPRFTHACNQ